MPSRLLNVRIGANEQQIIRELRARGVSISNLVRRAIRAETARAALGPRDIDRLFADAMSRHPTPGRTPNKRPKTTDRHAVSAYIRKRLSSRR